MIGSGQPQSDQTGAASRQVHSPLAQAGSFNTQMESRKPGMLVLFHLHGSMKATTRRAEQLVAQLSQM